jgi:hypothetical protein
MFMYICIYIGKEMTALRMKIDDLEKARVELVIELGNIYVYVYMYIIYIHLIYTYTWTKIEY